MKKLLLASVALFGFAGAAAAADLPVARAPPAPIIAAVPLFTWTGFYVGVNAGYGWKHQRQQRSSFRPAPSCRRPACRSPRGETTAAASSAAVRSATTTRSASSWSVSRPTSSSPISAARRHGLRPAGFRPLRSGGSDGGIDWFGTVRARAGFAFDRALVYATGGFAYGGADGNNGCLRRPLQQRRRTAPAGRSAAASNTPSPTT